jgi:phosphatidylserine synthase
MISFCYTCFMFQPDPFLNPVSYALFKSLPLVIMAVLIFNMIQRILWKGWGKKRAATFYMAMVLGAIFTAAALIMRYRLTDLLLIPAGLGIIVFIIIKRKAFFPFSMKCSQCGKQLSIKRIISGDSDLCAPCEDNNKGD